MSTTTTTTTPPPTISQAILQRQDDVTSGAVIALLKDNNAFRSLSGNEGQLIKARDDEDDAKLAVGIKASVDKGVLPATPDVGSVTRVNVFGKSSDDVAAEVLSKLASPTGNVLILQGLSGTGKGTTVQKLQRQLPQCITWSNGNVFRSLTYLISEATKASPWSADVVTPEVIKEAVAKLSFKKIEDDGDEGSGKEGSNSNSYDIIIDGNTRVKDVQNTLLKQPVISQRVPTVAGRTQGEVINLGAAAVETLRQNGYNVILEGRAQTLNYIPSQYRFELEMPNQELLGQRRAAQRVMAAALEVIGKDKKEEVSDEQVTKAVVEAAEKVQS